MLANRKAIGHDVNASTLLGDKLVGTTKLTPAVYEGVRAIVRSPLP